MTSLAQFHKQRARSVVPRTQSVRRWKRRRIEAGMRGGVVPRPTRVILARQSSRLHMRHSNVMDRFRFPEPGPGRTAKMRCRSTVERDRREMIRWEAHDLYALVHRARGQVEYPPAVDTTGMPVVGR